ncbi:MAG: hypothetical protein ACRDZ6_02410 [Acidimicrobiales bacterium]
MSACTPVPPGATSSTPPVGQALQTGSTCINPHYTNLAYNPSDPAPPSPGLSPSSPQCTEGDAIISGELRGKLTIATSGNIVVSNDVTYQCADGSGGASTADPDSVAACDTSGRTPFSAFSPRASSSWPARSPRAGAPTRPVRRMPPDRRFL